MTFTKDQAQMLATLAAACRPNGARRWDTAGIMAALEKVRDRSLAEVVLATVRAAADRDCDTPGVIPTPGTHWSEASSVRPFTPNRVDADRRCQVCSLSKPLCARLWADDHMFVSAATARAQAASTEAVHVAVAALREDLPPMNEPEHRRTLDELPTRSPHLRARVETVRAALSEGAAW